MEKERNIISLTSKEKKKNISLLENVQFFLTVSSRKMDWYMYFTFEVLFVINRIQQLPSPHSLYSFCSYSQLQISLWFCDDI